MRTQRTQSSDTAAQAEYVQAALLRGASVARRLGLVRALTSLVIGLSRRDIRRAHPDADEREVRVLSAARNYGTAWAQSLRGAGAGRCPVDLPPDLLDAVAPVIAAFARLGVPYYIGGGAGAGGR